MVLQHALCSVFGIEVRREMRETETQVLSLVGDARPGWDAAPASVKYDAATGLTAPSEELFHRMKAGEKFLWTMGSTAVLASELSQLLGQPVVDEAAVTGYYLFVLPGDIDTGDAQAIGTVLGEKYGMTLRTGMRKVETIVVEKAGGRGHP